MVSVREYQVFIQSCKLSGKKIDKNLEKLITHIEAIAESK